MGTSPWFGLALGLAAALVAARGLAARSPHRTAQYVLLGMGLLSLTLSLLELVH